MIDLQCDPKIDVLIKQCDYFWSKKEYYSAFVSLGLVWEALVTDSQEVIEALRKQLERFYPSHSVLENVVQKIAYNKDRIARIVTVGEVFDADEILLILVLRNDLDLVLRILKECFDYSVGISISEMEPRIREIAIKGNLTKKSKQLLLKMNSETG